LPLQQILEPAWFASVLKVGKQRIIELEANMNFIPKYKVVAAVVFLAGGITLPFCQAQTRAFSTVLNLNSNRSYLGIQMEDVTADNMSAYKLSNERGVIIRSVEEGSPAEKASLRANDVVLEYAGNQVWSTMQLSRLVQETPPGRNVDLVVSRDGKRLNLKVQIGNLDREANNQAGRLPGIIVPDGRFFQFRFPSIPDRRFEVRPEGRPRLGVTLQPLTDQLREFFGVPDKRGALVSSIVSGSPSDGKLKSGDVIVQADNTNIENPDDLVRFISDRSGGDVTLKVIRNKKEITVTVTLPAAESREGFKL
jgi:serine protease Do